MSDPLFFLKKFITAFILPPGLFVGIFFAAAVWQFSRKKHLPAFLMLALSALFWALSIPPCSDVLLRPLEKSYVIPRDPQADVIILLGGGIYDRSADFSGEGVPSADMALRVLTAARLQKKMSLPVIVSGGKVFDGKQPEAPVIKRILVDLGIPASSVLAEDQSRDTFENARFTRDILKKHNFAKPLLVTSAYHMKRSVQAFEKHGMNVIPFPSGFRTWDNKQYGAEDYLPSGGSFALSEVALREYVGLLFYRIAYQDLGISEYITSFRTRIRKLF